MKRSVLVWLALGAAGTVQAQPSWTAFRSTGMAHGPVIGVQSADKPATYVPERVQKLLVEHLGIKSTAVIGSARLAEDLGADSVDVVEVVMALEEEFGVTIPDKAVGCTATVDDLIKVVRNAAR
jgi:acyl carrier protein